MQIEDVGEEIGGTNRWALHRWPLVIGTTECGQKGYERNTVE